MFGVSGTKIIKELLNGNLSTEEMAALARGRLKKKTKELGAALEGYFLNHHKFMIETSLKHIDSLEKIIAELNLEIDARLEKYKDEIELLKTIPGIEQKTAATIISEIGVDMERFPTENHLSSWAGLSPGNNESAGKKKWKNNLW